MSKDLTDALRAMMAGDANTNVVPALKPRGAAPAITSAAPLPVLKISNRVLLPTASISTLSWKA